MYPVQMTYSAHIDNQSWTVSNPDWLLNPYAYSYTSIS